METLHWINHQALILSAVKEDYLQAPNSQSIAYYLKHKQTKIPPLFSENGYWWKQTTTSRKTQKLTWIEKNPLSSMFPEGCLNHMKVKQTDKETFKTIFVCFAIQIIHFRSKPVNLCLLLVGMFYILRWQLLLQPSAFSPLHRADERWRTDLQGWSTHPAAGCWDNVGHRESPLATNARFTLVRRRW